MTQETSQRLLGHFSCVCLCLCCPSSSLTLPAIVVGPMWLRPVVLLVLVLEPVQVLVPVLQLVVVLVSNEKVKEKNEENLLRTPLLRKATSCRQGSGYSII